MSTALFLDVVSRNILFLLISVGDGFFLKILEDLLSSLHCTISRPGLGKLKLRLRPFPVAWTRGRGPGLGNLPSAHCEVVDGCL